MSVPKLKRKYLQLYQDHASLYEMIIKRDTIPDEELNILDKMLDTRELLRQGILTEEEARDQAMEKALSVLNPDLVKPSKLSPPEQNITITEL